MFEPNAPADLIRVGQNVRNSLPVLREQIRMPFGDVALSLLSEFDLGFAAPG